MGKDMFKLISDNVKGSQCVIRSVNYYNHKSTIFTVRSLQTLQWTGGKMFKLISDNVKPN